MKVIRVKDSHEGGKIAYNLLREKVEQGAKVLGLATGSTPESLYEELVKSDVDFSQMTSVNLDEYVGISASNPQSYASFMMTHLFQKKPFAKSYLPDGMAADLTKEVKRYDQILSDNPVDVQILGIGQNGHIGFNEPGTSFDSTTHVVDLEESTIKANARFFEDLSQVPRQAISMGIASILSAKTIILMAYGSQKADAVLNTITGPITNDVPASILQDHDDVIMIVDDEAAEKLEASHAS